MIFALPHPHPMSTKDRMYSRHHSSARKAFERCFGALFSQFKILYYPCRLSNLVDMNDVVKTCRILHNMIGERRGYEGTRKFKKDLEEVQAQVDQIDIQQIIRPECRYEQCRFWSDLLYGIDSANDAKKLMTALSEHIWNISGTTLLDGSDEDMI